MTLDQIADCTTSCTILNALHACRDGHPLNNSYAWRNAYALIAARPSYEFTGEMVVWLATKADAEEEAGR